VFGFVVLALATPLVGQTAGLHIAVIDSDRIVAESARGKEILGRLKQVQDAKVAEGRQLQAEIEELQARLEEGQLSLAPERLGELNKQLEDKVISIRRFQDDAERELGKMQEEQLAVVERSVLQIIDEFGREQNYTFIFNKFRSGLVFASPSVDVTDEIIRRLDAAAAGSPG